MFIVILMVILNGKEGGCQLQTPRQVSLKQVKSLKRQDLYMAGP
jgi:hypothetical protein